MPQQAWPIWYAGLAHLNVSSGKWVEEYPNELALPSNPISLASAPYNSHNNNVMK